LTVYCAPCIRSGCCGMTKQASKGDEQ
jgi:hypothetical protein